MSNQSRVGRGAYAPFVAAHDLGRITEKLEACNYEKGLHCFANTEGKCRALSLTYPPGKPCPFYKTVRQVEKEDEAREEAKKLDRARAKGDSSV